MSIDSSTGEPVNEPNQNIDMTPHYHPHGKEQPYPNGPTRPVSKPSKAPVVILSILLMFVCLVSAYLFATAETGICADQIAKRGTITNVTVIDPTSFDKGYAKGISDTQNATLLLGYCSAQQEFVTNGVLLMNNTTLVTPVTLLKEICFR